jgi:hypothetical protein
VVVARRWGTSRASAGPAAPRPAGTAEPWPGWRSGWLARISTPATIALLTVVAVIVALELPAQPPPVIAAAAAALLASTGAFGWLLIRQPAADAPALAALAVAGLGGAALAGLLSGGIGTVIVDMAVAGLGLRLALRPALSAAVAVLAAANLALLLGGGTSQLLGLPIQDIAAAFLFALGAFDRSALIAHDRRGSPRPAPRTCSSSCAPRRRPAPRPPPSASGPGSPARSTTSSPTRCRAWC